jgi:HxlR-like helix-turn-helix
VTVGRCWPCARSASATTGSATSPATPARHESGVLEKRSYQDSPPRAGYHLTAAGRDLAPVLHALLEWGDRWAVDSPPVTIRHHGHKFRGQTVCATCGERVHARDLRRTVNSPGWELSGPVDG